MTRTPARAKNRLKEFFSGPDPAPMALALASAYRVRRNRHRWRRIASGRQDYNYYRDYEPGTGRYVESDPIGLNGGISTYGYVSAAPLDYKDPLGLVEWTGTISFGRITAGIKRKGFGLTLGSWSDVTLDVESECIDNKKVHAVIKAWDFVLFDGAGLIATGGVGKVRLQDGLSAIDPNSLVGALTVKVAGNAGMTGTVTAGRAEGGYRGLGGFDFTGEGKLSNIATWPQNCGCTVE